MLKKIFIFIGPPGSGKGTQADKLGEKLKLPVISPGELLRHEEEKGTSIGKMVRAKMAKGELVSDEIIEKVLHKRLAKKDAHKGFILDGYPRDLVQLELLKKKISKFKDPTHTICAVYIDCQDKNIKKRLGGRRVCDCGAAYHTEYNPPKKKGICDLCGKKLERREDDKPQVMARRLKQFHLGTTPILKFFKDEHLLIIINGDKEIKQVEKEINAKLKACPLN
jgi:adenylate kinase